MGYDLYLFVTNNHSTHNGLVNHFSLINPDFIKHLLSCYFYTVATFIEFYYANIEIEIEDILSYIDLSNVIGKYIS